MRSYVANALRIGVAFAVVITFLSCILCDKVLGLVNTPADIHHDAYVFLFMQFLAIPFTIGYNLLAGSYGLSATRNNRSTFSSFRRS